MFLFCLQMQNNIHCDDEKLFFFGMVDRKTAGKYFQKGPFFDSYLAILWPTLGHSWGDSPQFARGFQPPFLRHPPLDPACPPFLKSLCPLPSVLLHPLLRYFRQFPHPHANPSSPNLTNQLSWFKLSKGQIYQFNCCLLSKINFNLLNPFTSRLS